MTDQATPGFADLALSAPVLTALSRIGYEQPSPIQAKSIPILLEGHDLLGIAQTGTGKTAAFALPLLSMVNVSLKAPQILVLAPTRELAIQVAEAFQNYASEIRGFNVLPIYGGQNMGVQLRSLRRGVQVIVGTPGRVKDHLSRGSLKLDQLTNVVLDEADEMLRMGFIDDVEWILDHTPDKKQVALFSATMPAPIRRVAKNYLVDPQEVKIQPQSSTVDRIEQVFWSVKGVNKLDALTRVLEMEDFDATIIFVRTKAMSEELANKLEARGYSASAINGDMNQKVRERTIEQLKSGELDILVATDVAARGIDVQRVSHVINYDIPYDSEAYVHRIGRTGRAGRSGKAILFVAPRERNLLRTIERNTKKRIEQMQLPSRDQVNSKRISDFKTSINEALQSEELEVYQNLVQEFIGSEEMDPVQLATALTYLSLKDKLLDKKDERAYRDNDRGDRRDRNDRHERGDRRDRHDRGDRNRGDRGERRERSDRGEKRNPDTKMERYRISVGRDHDVSPGDIVGAIANEANISSQFIGRIILDNDHSTVDLPEGMPNEVFDHLRKVYVKSQKMEITKLDEPAFIDDGGRREPRDRKFARGGHRDDRGGDRDRGRSDRNRGGSSGNRGGSYDNSQRRSNSDDRGNRSNSSDRGSNRR